MTCLEKNIIDTPNCLCGKQEDAYHFFFTCKKYSNARHVMFDKLFSLEELSIIDTNTLLWGHENLRYDINCKNFSAVQNYISMSDRFN